MPLPPELLRNVKRARVLYAERMKNRDERGKRRKPDGEDDGTDDANNKRFRSQLEEKVAACRALLKRAEDIISSGLRANSFEQVQTWTGFVVRRQFLPDLCSE